MDLQLSDVVEGYSEEETAALMARFRKRWRRGASLWKVLSGMFVKDLVGIAVMGTLYLLFMAGSIVIMASLINELLEGGKDKRLWMLGAGYALSVLLSQTFYHLQFRLSTDIFLRMRKILAAVLYEKLMSISLESLAE